MLKISKLPVRAGIIKLINQMLTAVRLIPRLFALNKPNNFKLTFPRRLRSVNKAIVGITAIIKNETLTDHKPCHHETSTLNKRNNR